MRDKRTPKNVCGEANIFVAVAIVLIKLISIDKVSVLVFEHFRGKNVVEILWF